MRKLLIAIMSTVLLITASSAIAQTNAQTEPPAQKVQIRLLPERSEIQPKEEIWIGIEQSIIPHWHTYWQNPGDSGTPFRIKWNLPEGFEISNIHWPVPKKIPYGPLLNYGYEDNVVLLQKLTAPDELPEEPVTLTADIELLVCKETCIPEYGSYDLTLNDPESMGEDNAAYLEKALTKLPENKDILATFSETDKNFTLTLDIDQEETTRIDLNTLQILPIDWGLVDNTANAKGNIDGTELTITQKRGDRALSDLKTINALVTYQTAGGDAKAIQISAAHQTTAPTIGMPAPEITPAISQISLAQAILYALIGGMILNLMPCVFPVLSLKALSLVKIADRHPTTAKIHGLAYTAGVILSFIAVASLLLLLKSAGEQIGWGFHLQNPVIIAALAVLLFIIGLNLAGFFEFGKNLAIGQKLTEGNKPVSSFFTGILATIVATPCTAPFMAGAIGFALTQTPLVNLTVFAALGLGLALPYLALSFAPALQSALPKPGAWMNTFKQLLAFPMFLTAIWLVWVLGKQAGTFGILQILIAMTAITFGLWLQKHKPAKTLWRKILRVITLLTFALGIILIAAQKTRPSDPQTQNAAKDIKQTSQAFSPERLDDLLNTDMPVFVEMTAAWCITCKVNQAVAIDTKRTKELFKDNNVTYLIGDWTNQDPEITKYLNTYGRDGVPLYVYYGPKNPQTQERPEPYVLPQILTPGIIADLFKKET